MSAFSAGSIVGRLVLDTSGYTGGMLQANALTGVFGSTLSGFLVSPLLGALGLIKQVGGALLDMATAGLGTGVKLAAEAEQAEIAFGVMLGSADAAKAMLADLTQFAASTPFEFPELRDAARTLLAFQIPAGELLPTMRMLGDVSAGTGARIADLALIYGQANGAQRAYTGDLNQLAMRGVPIWSELTKIFGVTGAEMRKLAENGAVTFGHLQQVFRTVTGEGGLFQGMMQAQSQSLGGLWSTARDTVNDSLRAIATEMLKGLGVKEGLGGAIAFMGQMMPTIVAGAVVVGQYLGGAFAQLRDVVTPFLPTLGELGVAFLGASVNATGGLLPALTGIVMLVGSLLQLLTPVLVPAITLVGAVLRGLGEIIRVIGIALAPVLGGLGAVVKVASDAAGLTGRTPDFGLGAGQGNGGAGNVTIQKVEFPPIDATEASGKIAQKIEPVVKRGLEAQQRNVEGAARKALVAAAIGGQG